MNLLNFQPPNRQTKYFYKYFYKQLHGFKMWNFQDITFKRKKIIC